MLDAELTKGGVFDSASEPVTQTPGYGTFTVTFSDCMNGTVAYEFPGIGKSGTIPISRAAADNAALCEALLGQ